MPFLIPFFYQMNYSYIIIIKRLLFFVTIVSTQTIRTATYRRQTPQQESEKITGEIARQDTTADLYSISIGYSVYANA